MATQSFSSAEFRYLGAGYAEGSTGGTAAVFDTSVVRSGGASFRCDGTAANASYHTSISPTAATFNTVGKRAFHVRWYQASALPSGTPHIWGLITTGTELYVSLNSSGDLTFGVGAVSSNARTFGTLSGAVAAGAWFGLKIERQIVSTSTATNQARAWFCAEGDIDVLIGEATNLTAAEMEQGGAASFPYNDHAGWITAPGNTVSMYVDDGLCHDNSGWAQNPSTRTKILRAVADDVVTNTSSQWHTCRTTTYTKAHTLEAANAVVTGAHADSTSDGAAHQHRNTSAASTGAPSILELRYQSYGRMGIPGHCIVTGGGAGRQSVGDASARTRIAQGIYGGPTIANVELSLMKVGSPTDNLVIEIQSDSSGAPSGTVLASATLAGTDLTTSVADYRVDMMAPIGLATKAWIVLSRSGSVDGSNYYQVQTCSTASIYPDGGTAAHNGTAWGSVDQTAAWVFEALNDSGQAWIVNIIGFIYQGEAVATGTKTGSHKFTVPSGSDVTFTYRDDGVICAAWPTGWTLSPALFASGFINVAPGYPSMNQAVQFRFTKTDTGTRAVNVVGPFILVEYSEPLPGWNQFTKTSDSSVWWGKYAPTRMQWAEYPSGVETGFTVEAGQWVLAPDPLPDDGQVADFTVVDDATLKANYTPA